jgi:hypothetical protein
MTQQVRVEFRERALEVLFGRFLEDLAEGVRYEERRHGQVQRGDRTRDPLGWEEGRVRVGWVVAELATNVFDVPSQQVTSLLEKERLPLTRA